MMGEVLGRVAQVCALVLMVAITAGVLSVVANSIMDLLAR